VTVRYACGTSLVIMKRMGRILLFGFIILLGIQLTGLSCLNEWQIVSTTGALAISGLFINNTEGTGQPEQDGCPCHLALAPVYAGPLIQSSPDQPNCNVMASTHTLAFAFLPFHPPLLS